MLTVFEAIRILLASGLLNGPWYLSMERAGQNAHGPTLLNDQIALTVTRSDIGIRIWPTRTHISVTKFVQR